jgi:hypothetical protein
MIGASGDQTSRVRSLTRATQRILAAAVMVSAIAAGSATAATTATPPMTAGGAQVTSLALQVQAAGRAPCVVTGYTLHAEQQMAARNISSDQVENVVHDTCSRATWRPSNSTWQYTDGRIRVSANTNGYVVTVIRL